MAILASVSELQNVTVDERGAAVVITLNRPEKRNALSLALMQELCGVLEAVECELRGPRGRARGSRRGVLGRARPERDGGP